MRVILRSLQKAETPVEIELSDTVGTLKSRAGEALKLVSEGIRLCYNSSQLTDASVTLDKLVPPPTEGTVFVYLYKAPRAAAAAAPASAAAAAAPAAAPAPAPAPATVSAAEATSSPSATPSAETSTSQPAPAPEPAPEPAPSNTASASEQTRAASDPEPPTELVETVMAIGGEMWSRELVIRALRASLGSTEVALEALMTPNGLERLEALARPTPVPHAGAMDADDDDDVDEATQLFSRLMSSTPAARQVLQEALDIRDPQALTRARNALGAEADLNSFSPLVRVLAQIPQFSSARMQLLAGGEAAFGAHMDRLMTELSAAHPRVYQLIHENRQEFVELIQNGLPRGATQAARNAREAARAPARAPEPAPAAQSGGLTEEQLASVKQLEELGGGAWPRQRIVEMLLACDGNLEHAAQLLLQGLD